MRSTPHGHLIIYNFRKFLLHSYLPGFYLQQTAFDRNMENGLNLKWQTDEEVWWKSHIFEDHVFSHFIYIYVKVCVCVCFLIEIDLAHGSICSYLNQRVIRNSKGKNIIKVTLEKPGFESSLLTPVYTFQVSLRYLIEKEVYCCPTNPSNYTAVLASLHDFAIFSSHVGS